MSSSISIPGYNANNRVPGVFCVVDATKANTAVVNQVTLLIGQMLESGLATPNVPVISAGVGDAQKAFGAGSQLAIMVERYRGLDPTGTVYCLPLADASVTVDTSGAQGEAGTALTFASGSLGAVVIGDPVSGTDIAADTMVAAVDNAAGTVTLSAATSAAVASGTAITFGTASAAATATVAFAGTATAAGVIPLYVNAASIPVPVNLGDTAAMVATAAAAAVNAWTSAGGNPLDVTVAADDGTVTLTARNKGSLGNQGTILLSYLGAANGEGQPGSTNVSGITATITAFSGGTTDPTLTTALANLPREPFDFICCPYSDATALNAIQAFLGDAAGRWNWSVELFGGAFTAKGGTLAERTTWSTARNDQHASAIGAYNSPSPDWHWAVDYCAAAAVSIRSNPTVPIGGLAGGVGLNVLAPPLPDQDDFEEQETLLFDGMSTYVANQAGQVAVQRAITTYQVNGAGQPDNSYLNLNVPYQLMAFMRAFVTLMSSQFNQVILVNDGSPLLAGSKMVTSQTILYAVVAMYQAMATTGIPGVPAGLVQNPDAFRKNARAENAGGGIVRMLLPVQLGNQLIAIAANVQFTQP